MINEAQAPFLLIALSICVLAAVVTAKNKTIGLPPLSQGETEQQIQQQHLVGQQQRGAIPKLRRQQSGNVEYPTRQQYQIGNSKDRRNGEDREDHGVVQKQRDAIPKRSRKLQERRQKSVKMLETFEQKQQRSNIVPQTPQQNVEVDNNNRVMEIKILSPQERVITIYDFLDVADNETLENYYDDLQATQFFTQADMENNTRFLGAFRYAWLALNTEHKRRIINYLFLFNALKMVNKQIIHHQWLNEHNAQAQHGNRRLSRFLCSERLRFQKTLKEVQERIYGRLLVESVKEIHCQAHSFLSIVRAHTNKKTSFILFAHKTSPEDNIEQLYMMITQEDITKQRNKSSKA